MTEAFIASVYNLWEMKLMKSIEEISENIKLHLENLSAYTATPGCGVTRLPFSKEAKEAVSYLKTAMEEAGLEAFVDMAGNVRGILKADKPDARTIIMGSHYDTVKSGGKYDGIAGVVCAIETAKVIAESNIKREYNLEIIGFNDEEGCMFGSGCFGSKSLTGQVDLNYINHLTDENGISISEWMKRWGFDPEKIEENRLDMEKMRAFFEIHIEQGPVLDTEKTSLGIVNGIVGLLRCMATVEGRADHAGTTPMNMRKDALGIASKVIGRLEDIATAQNNGSVATCGFIRAYPNAMNVIAKKAEFTMDLRSVDDNSIENMKDTIWKLLSDYTDACGASYDIDVKLRQPAVRMNRQLVEALEEKCRNNGYTYKEMVSGAAHDAMVFADKTDTVMVFVPSLEGRSHCPEEYSDCTNLSMAVKIVCETIEDMISGKM